MKDSFNLGAHLNHEFFWESLCPIYQEGGVLPIAGSPLGRAIIKSFGSPH